MGSDVERFGISSSVGSKKADYTKMDIDGLPFISEIMENGDILIGKRMHTTQIGNDKKKKTVQIDHSTILPANENMRVDKIILTTNKDGGKLARVRLHAIRTPEIGDKFSSHHGQKVTYKLLTS